MCVELTQYVDSLIVRQGSNPLGLCLLDNNICGVGDVVNDGVDDDALCGGCNRLVEVKGQVRDVHRVVALGLEVALQVHCALVLERRLHQVLGENITETWT